MALVCKVVEEATNVLVIHPCIDPLEAGGKSLPAAKKEVRNLYKIRTANIRHSRSQARQDRASTVRKRTAV